MGLSPEVAYWMTSRQIDRAVEGYRMKERAAWERTLRMTGMWGDKLTADKLFSGSTAGAGAGGFRMSAPRYRSLKQRMGYA